MKVIDPSVSEDVLSAIDTVGGRSSSVIWTVAVPVPIAALTGFDNWTVKFSLCSSVVSFVIVTSKVALVCPATMVTLSLMAVKSEPAIAVPLVVA